MARFEVKDRIQYCAFVIAVGICFVLSVCFVIKEIAFLNLSCEVQLDGRINPNEASRESLMRLPGIGPKLASSIVRYRDSNFVSGKKQIFKNIDDLEKVKGIGPKRAKDLCKWLKFE